MAQITFRAMVHAIEPDRRRIRVSERLRKRGEAGAWETTGYIEYQVYVADLPEGLELKSIVTVEGSFFREDREVEGKHFVNLLVKRARVELVPPRTDNRPRPVYSTVSERPKPKAPTSAGPSPWNAQSVAEAWPHQ